MWKRRTEKELKELALRQRREIRSPRLALLFAALFAVIASIAWAGGARGKYSQRPPDPKSWSQIIHDGPIYFAICFVGLFLLIYAFQRSSRKRLDESEVKVFICPKCHTAQHAHERCCACAEPLEPFENWKWVERA